MSRAPFFISILAVLAVVLAACGGGEEPTPVPPPPTPQPAATPTTAAIQAPPAEAAPEDVVVIALQAQNDSGQAGIATLTARENATEVVVDVSVGPAGAGVAQPAHIHTGPCDSLGGVVHPLSNVVDGKSTSTVNASLDSLLTGGFAINLHKSGQEAAVYTACGELPAKGNAITISLNAQNSSGQRGYATLITEAGTTAVAVAVSVGPAGAGVAQPAHIHTGPCDSLGGVVHLLSNVVDGKSTSTVNASLDSLLTGGFAINLHKSGQEAAVYTACGNIPAKGVPGQGTSTSGGMEPYGY